MLSQDEVKRIFSEAKAIIVNDHFVYAKKPDGWYHGPDYVNKDAIYPHRRALKLLCKEIANHFFSQKIEVVVGPTIGGVSLSQWVSDFLDCGGSEEVKAVYADEEDVFDDACAKIGTRRVLKRGYDKFVNGKRCLIVEDVINSGATVVKTIRAVCDAGGIIAGVGALCNRSGGRVTAATFGITSLFSLLNLDMQMFKEEECPICKERGVKSVRLDLGKGKEFLSRIHKS